MLATIPISPSKQGTTFLPDIEKYCLYLYLVDEQNFNTFHQEKYL